MVLQQRCPNRERRRRDKREPEQNQNSVSFRKVQSAAHYQSCGEQNERPCDKLKRRESYGVNPSCGFFCNNISERRANGRAENHHVAKKRSSPAEAEVIDCQNSCKAERTAQNFYNRNLLLKEQRRQAYSYKRRAGGDYRGRRR